MSTPATLLHSANTDPDTDSQTTAWKSELNARLQKHREENRERKGETASRMERSRASGADTPASSVAARVAARYSAAPSYQELLAASASAAAIAAESALEAHAVAQAVLAEWELAEPKTAAVAPEPTSGGVFDDPFFTGDPRDAAPMFPQAPSASTIEHHEPLPARFAVPPRAPAPERALTLVDAFAEAVVPAAQGLPAKLIEFPRELVAPRKQRPRLAEGPLFEQESPGGSLRIFEVEQADGRDLLQADSMEYREAARAASHRTQTEFSDGDDNGMARERPSNGEENEPRRRGTFHFGTETVKQPQSGWGAIRLGEHPQPEAATEPVAKEARRPEYGYSVETEPALNELAPIGDRMMAALVDAGIVFGCFLLSMLVFASCTVHPPAGKGALAISFLVLGVLGAFYGWLFMTHGGGSTPGMRYARIALCTFADENPSRKDLQNRIPATALALLPLGLGMLWALLDEDKLGWHDRMTRTYQRTYR